MQKKLLTAQNVYDILKSIRSRFSVADREIYIICCVTIVAMILLRLRLGVGRILALEVFNRPMSIEASACRAGNSEIFASLSCLGCLVDSDFFGPSSNWRERQCKFLSDWQQVRCVFNEYLRKILLRIKKKYRYCAKKLLTASRYV
jgi:hypothetical protein